MNNKSKTIAVLIPHLDQYYQRDLWQSILKEADRMNYNMLFFCGGVLNSPLRDERENNIIYNLCNLDQVAGIISISGTLSNYSGIEVFKDFISRFSQKPLINISLELDDSNSVTVDNYKSMKGLMDHVLTHHDYKKYAYISGPSTNSESIRRTKAFEDAMIAYKIPPENIVRYEGDFSVKSAVAAVGYFFDKLKFIPDLIICANDEMAIGVHEALIERGINMPEQIAFTGFDDIDNATTFVPAFTTIKQPLHELGKESVQGLHQLITGQVKSLNKPLAGNLVIRESCGCFNALNNRYLMNNESSVYSEPRKPIKGDQSIPETLQAIDEAYQGRYANEVHELLAILILELKREAPKGVFLKNLSKVCYQAVSTDTVLFDSRWFITWLRQSLNAYDALYESVELNEIIYECTIVIGDLLTSNERRSNYDFLEMYYYSSELILELTQVTEVEQLFQVVIPYLKAFSFDEFYVCLFDEPMYFQGNDTFVFPDEMNMQLRYTKNGVLPPCRYNTKTILPPELLGADCGYQFIFYPLFFRKRHYGYIMCDIKIASKSVFRTIKEQIANTLERLRVNEKLEEYNLQLKAYNKQLADMAIKDAMTGILNRRGIFEYLDFVMEEAHITSQCIGVVFSDIDGLKTINDVYGHQSGDVAIKAISGVLLEVFSPYGEVARLGGDEFICIIKDHKDDEHITALLLKVTELLESYNSKKLHPFKLSLSMGFSKWDPVGNQTINQILNESDKALYRNKRRFRA